MCRGRFSSSLKSADHSIPPLSPSLFVSPASIFLHTNLSSLSSFLLPLPRFIQPLFYFFHHLLSLTHYTLLVLPSYSYHPPSLSLLAFILSYYYSLSIPPPSSSLCHSGRAAGRQRQHTLMLLYLTRHTHTLSCPMHDCTNIRKRGRGGGATHTYTHKKDSPQTYV